MLIGLTGGIGAGKSLVSRRLKQLGAYIIDADVVAREVVEPGQPAHGEIVQRFGRSVLAENGEIDRKALAKLVFRDETARNDLEAITHPRILKRIEELSQKYHRENPRAVVVIDAPLLIETGIHRQVQQVWVVTAKLKQRIERVVRRDNMSEEQVKRRIEAQLSDAERIKHAHVVIDNSGTPEQTLALVDKLWQELQQ